jgi:hypothetical protein
LINEATLPDQCFRLSSRTGKNGFLAGLDGFFRPLATKPAHAAVKAGVREFGAGIKSRPGMSLALHRARPWFGGRGARARVERAPRPMAR